MWQDFDDGYRKGSHVRRYRSCRYPRKPRIKYIFAVVKKLKSLCMNQDISQRIEWIQLSYHIERATVL